MCFGSLEPLFKLVLKPLKHTGLEHLLPLRKRPKERLVCVGSWLSLVLACWALRGRVCCDQAGGDEHPPAQHTVSAAVPGAGTPGGLVTSCCAFMVALTERN